MAVGKKKRNDPEQVPEACGCRKPTWGERVSWKAGIQKVLCP